MADMHSLKRPAVWGGLFLGGLASLAIVALVAFFYFGYGPTWLDWWAIASMSLTVVAMFGWLVTFIDRPRTPS
jgi:hypothetical protein